MLKFYWNGIKDQACFSRVESAPLQTCSYSDSELCNYPGGTITIYKREYTTFSRGIYFAFPVENDSDMQSDYCMTDLIRVTPEHPLYVDVARALQAMKAHNAKRYAKRTVAA